jgi:hypothetical protein
MDFHELVESRFHAGTFFAACKNQNGTISEASISVSLKIAFMALLFYFLFG